MLCVDEDAGLAAEDDAAAPAFFDATGNAGPETKAVMDLLAQIERYRAATERAASLLAAAGVLRPWPLPSIVGSTESALTLHRVDEQALLALDPGQYDALRGTEAFALAYAHLFSMGRLKVLEQLQAVRRASSPPPMPDTLDKVFGLNNDNLVRFD